MMKGICLNGLNNTAATELIIAIETQIDQLV